MAGKVVGWAFDQARALKLGPTQRFILVAYADNASEAEGKCWPDKEEITEKTGYSQATIYRAIKELESRDLIVFTEDSKGRPCAYLSVPWFSHSENGDSQSEKKNSHSEKGTNNKGNVKEPSQGKSEKKTVDRKVVSEREWSLTELAVSVFNDFAGTALSAEPHMTPIVMRLREKPDYDERQIRAITEAVFEADHWWTGAPTPRIIYGNAAQFEASIELARAAAKREPEYDPTAAMRKQRREQGLE